MHDATLPSSHLVDLDHIKADGRQIRDELFRSGDLTLNPLNAPRSDRKAGLWRCLQQQILQRSSDGL